MPEVEVIRENGAIDALPEGWDAFVDSVGADIYFTSAWLKPWWRHHGAGRQPLLVVARSGERIVGILPFFVESFGYPPFRMKVARLAGMNSLFPAVCLPVAAEGRITTLVAMFKAVAARADIDAISIFPFSECDPVGPDMDAALEAVSRDRDWAVIRNDTPKSHMIQYLQPSFDAYVGALSSRRRKGYRNSLARLTKAMAISNELVPPDKIDAAFARFVDLHSRQWQAIGKGGHFSDWPQAEALYGELLRTLAPSGRGVIIEYRSGDRVLSSQIGFRQGDRFYWRLCARTLDEDVAKLGIGNLSLLATIEWLIGQGVRVFEDAAGTYDYKESYGGEQAGIRRIFLTRPTASSRLKGEALIGIGQALDFFHYRIWFQRVAPRLRRVFGGTPKPLPSSWIRTRL